MQELAESNPAVYHSFSKGLFVVRRSDREWGGISTDQIIEQCLMRNLKTSGGLTRGSGMSEMQRNTWTASMPVCVSVDQAMQELTNTDRRSGEQNQEIGASRISRDWEDSKKVMAFFKERDPFSYGPVLCNIANGVHAQASVNVENAREVGNCIILKMEGAKVSDFSFK